MAAGAAEFADSRLPANLHRNAWRQPIRLARRGHGWRIQSPETRKVRIYAQEP